MQAAKSALRTDQTFASIHKQLGEHSGTSQKCKGHMHRPASRRTLFRRSTHLGAARHTIHDEDLLQLGISGAPGALLSGSIRQWAVGPVGHRRPHRRPPPQHVREHQRHHVPGVTAAP